ncbi:MAG: hypothetical protein KIT09_22870 [Bryobacteraceae bacterium]|nr:hypothetical protein [Bryobacteraceae bacterium]
MRTITFIATLLGAAALLSCGGEQPPATAQADAPASRIPVGVLDAPQPGETIRGSYKIRGWALDESGIRDVAVYVDRSFAGTARIGLHRPDLIATYSAFPDAEIAGFEFTWNAAAAPAGPHEVTVQARAKNGAVRDVGSVSIVTAEP